MIINGGSRSNGAFFARHLLKQDNERVAVIELRGVTASTIPAALREMKMIASGSRTTKNYLYHASMSPDGSATLTAEQWQEAADILERHLGLTGQPRVVVEHQKAGRVHQHVVWSRIAIVGDSLRAVSDSLTFAKHERASREIEQRFGHPPVPSVLVKDRKTPRPPRRPTSRESFRGQDSGLNPQAITAEVTALWHAAASGEVFASALALRGYILAAGDRRDFVLVDSFGDDHSLARRISGIKAADIRTRLADIDRAALPSVCAARALARQSNAGGGTATSVTPATHAARPVTTRDGPVGEATFPTPKIRPPAVPKPRGEGRSDPATAAAQVRQVTEQYARRLRRRPAMLPSRVNTLPRRTAARDAAEAAAQIEAITRPFVRALLRSGIIPAMVTAIVETGISWAELAAHYAETFLEDVRDTVMGRPTTGRG